MASVDFCWLVLSISIDKKFASETPPNRTTKYALFDTFGYFALISTIIDPVISRPFSIAKVILLKIARNLFKSYLKARLIFLNLAIAEEPTFFSAPSSLVPEICLLINLPIVLVLKKYSKRSKALMHQCIQFMRPKNL